MVSICKLFATYIVSVCIVVISMHNSFKPPPIDLHRRSGSENLPVKCCSAVQSTGSEIKKQTYLSHETGIFGVPKMQRNYLVLKSGWFQYSPRLSVRHPANDFFILRIAEYFVQLLREGWIFLSSCERRRACYIWTAFDRLLFAFLYPQTFRFILLF